MWSTPSFHANQAADLLQLGRVFVDEINVRFDELCILEVMDHTHYGLNWTPTCAWEEREEAAGRRRDLSRDHLRGQVCTHWAATLLRSPTRTSRARLALLTEG